MTWLPDILQHVFAFERAAATPYTFATTFVPTMSAYYVMAVLVQLPHTDLYRAALLPVVFWMTLRTNTVLDLSCNDPGFDQLNYTLALGMFGVAMRSTAWAFAKRPYTRYPICKTGDDVVNVQKGKTVIGDNVSISSALWNACDLVVNFRLIGWNEPRKRYIPAPSFRVESRLAFALITLCQLVFVMVTFDAVCKGIHFLGPDSFGTPKGGTIFDISLPPLERYSKSIIVSLLAVASAYLTFTTVYKLNAFLFTILFQQSQSQWPPLFDSPWSSTSLASFWGRGWHQLLREFLVGVTSPLLGRPFGHVGTILGTFVLSGVMHDIGSRRMGHREDTISVVGFFLIHGVGVAIEFAWKRATGKRVGGVTGWLWTASWFLLTGPLLMDVWGRRGLLGSATWPDAYSPATLILNWISWKNKSS